jgi:hypothetical protein
MIGSHDATPETEQEVEDQDGRAAGPGERPGMKVPAPPRKGNGRADTGPERRPLLPTSLFPLLLILLLSGCTVRLSAPEVTGPGVSIFLLDHGRHSSLVLPRGGGEVVRYSYGDWLYYAEAVTGFRSAAAAALWPTRAALGRRVLDANPVEEEVRRAVRVGVESILVLEVEADRVARLSSTLDSLFHAGAEEELRLNPLYDLEFVPHPRPYSVAHHSNQVVAGWLRELGVATRGLPLSSSWSRQAEPRKGGGGEWEDGGT